MSTNLTQATLVITQAGTLAIVIGSIVAEDAAQLQVIRQLGPDEAANITRLAEFVESETAATQKLIEDWRARHPKT